MLRARLSGRLRGGVRETPCCRSPDALTYTAHEPLTDKKRPDTGVSTRFTGIGTLLPVSRRGGALPAATCGDGGREGLPFNEGKLRGRPLGADGQET